MKLLLQLLTALLLMAIGNLKAQVQDTTVIVGSNEIVDLAQNRLFMMSTGRTMPAQKFSAGDFEIFLLQLGYAPADFAHLNFTYILPLGGPSPYWSFGTKVQIVKQSGLLKGVAIGADVGFFDELFGVSSNYNTANDNTNIVSLNAAVTAGGDDANLHLNIAQLFPTSNHTSVEIEFPTYIQTGFDFALSHRANGGGMKFMTEMLMTLTKRNFAANIVFVGLRSCGKSSVAEFGWPFSLGTSGAGASPVPYFSLTFFF
jgi:hypothetical protein